MKLLQDRIRLLKAQLETLEKAADHYDATGRYCEFVAANDEIQRIETELLNLQALLVQ